MLRVIYRILLHACPPAVRREYGAEMEDGFVHSLAVERTAAHAAPAGPGRSCGDWPTSLIFACSRTMARDGAPARADGITTPDQGGRS